MKAVRLILIVLIWFAILLPMCFVLQGLHGWILASAVYSYVILSIFAVIIVGTFDEWFKSKLK